jgi:hypothetical protein
MFSHPFLQRDGNRNFTTAPFPFGPTPVGVVPFSRPYPPSRERIDGVSNRGDDLWYNGDRFRQKILIVLRLERLAGIGTTKTGLWDRRAVKFHSFSANFTTNEIFHNAG